MDVSAISQACISFHTSQSIFCQLRNLPLCRIEDGQCLGVSQTNRAHRSHQISHFSPCYVLMIAARLHLLNIK